MENASKALIMAGSILLAIIILSIMAYMFSNMEMFGTQYSKTLNDQATEEFNTKFNVYKNRELNIYDVITLYNLQQTYKDEVKIYDKANIINKINDKNNMMTEENRNKKYICEITYNDGKVNTITINPK